MSRNITHNLADVVGTAGEPLSISDFVTFVVYCMVVVTVVVFFLFYFNRFFGQLLSRVIRFYTWRRYNVYIEIESLQFALLGGRILFKNLRYHSTNQSICILKGHITLRYWLWNVRKEGDPKPDSSNNKLPSRIICNIQGCEWFIYNRLEAYKAMETFIEITRSTSQEHQESNAASVNDTAVKIDDQASVSAEAGVANSLFRRLLPIQIDCEHGAVIVGNPSVSHLLVMEFYQCKGTYNTGASRSNSDLYRTSIELVFQEAKANLKFNADHRETILQKARREMDTPSTPQRRNIFDKVTDKLRNRRSGNRESVPPESEWRGLERYRRVNGMFSVITDLQKEYAEVSQILEAETLTLTYYVDMAGLVPRDQQPNGYFGSADIGNGNMPPEWGIDIKAKHGFIHYGPWADRQRSELQKVFFPSPYRNGIKSDYLVPGQTRVHTILKILINFESEMTLRIPLREASKNWKFDDSTGLRPYGWVDMKIGTSSKVVIRVPMVTDETGSTNLLEIDLSSLTVVTSTNYSTLLSSSRVKVQAEMHNPLQWNAQRRWTFKFDVREPHIYLLRDHITLFQDLVKDWAAGPPPDILSFVPILYSMEFTLRDFRLHLYVNEHNIINNPAEMTDNALIIINGTILQGQVDLPFIAFDAEMNKIPFNLEVENAMLEMNLPSSHTLGAFLTETSRKFATGNNLKLDGSYLFFSDVDDQGAHIESLDLHIKCKGVNVTLFGFVVRYFLILQDNYFGRFIDFLTLDEYKYRHEHSEETALLNKKQNDAKPSENPFEVYLVVIVEEGKINLPENLYDCTYSSVIEFHELQLELRNLDIYMDMFLGISPATWTRENGPVSKKYNYKPKARDHHNYVYIDEFNIHAHRMYGPRPSTTTYLCHWEFDIGSVTGQVKPSFLLGISAFGETFAYNMADEENAIPPNFQPELVPDVTFVKASIREIDIGLWAQDSAAVQLLLPQGLRLDFDNLVNQKWNQRVILTLPQLIVRNLANTEYASRLVDDTKQTKQEDHPWVEVANLNTGMNITFYRSVDWQRNREKQQTFIKEQDRETHRCPHLYEIDYETMFESRSQRSLRSQKSSYEYHVGVLYAPPYPSFESGEEEEEASTSIRGRLTPQILEMVGERDFRDDTSFVENLSSRGSRSSMDTFVTATDGSDDENNEEEDYERYSSNSGSSESENDIEPEDEELKASVRPREMDSTMPRSIPYRTYLKRYRVSNEELYGNNFSNKFAPPPRIYFIPATATRTQSQASDEEEVTTPLKRSVNISYPKSEDMSEPVQRNNEDDESEGSKATVTLVLESAKTVRILLTPIFVKIVQEILEAINVEHWDLESMLDSTQIEYISTLTSFLKDRYVSTHFAVSVPRIEFHFIQDVMLPDDLTVLNDDQPLRTRYDLTNTVLCSADVVFDQLSLMGSVEFEDQAFGRQNGSTVGSTLKLLKSRAHMDFESLSCNVRFVGSLASDGIFGIPEQLQASKNIALVGESLANEPVVIDVVLRNFGVRWLGATQPNYFELNIGQISSVIITQSIEILVGSIYSWLAFVEDFKTLLDDFNTRRSKQLQVLISNIADFSKSPNVVKDPVFLTTPANRLGARNFSFRHDIGWRLLAHMRHCMREMPSAKRKQLQCDLTSGDAIKDVNSVKMFEKVINIFSQWRSWEIGDISKCRLLTVPFNQEQKKLFDISGDVTAELIETLKKSCNSMSIHVHGISVCIYEQHFENSISIGSIFFTSEIFFRETIPNIGIDEPRKSTDAEAIKTNGYLNVFFNFKLESIDIVANPTVLSFAKHMIRVQRIFTEKLATLSKSSAKVIPPSDERERAEKRASYYSATSKPELKIFGVDLSQLLDRLPVVAHGLAVVSTITLNATAHNLVMENQLLGIHGSIQYTTEYQSALPQQSKGDKEGSDVLSTIRSSQRGSRKSSQVTNTLIMSAMGGIDSFSTAIKEKKYLMKERMHSTRLNPQFNTLLSVDVQEIRSNVAISRQLRKKNKGNLDSLPMDVVNSFFALKKVSIELPQSLLRLYKFVEDWSEENLPTYDFLFKNFMIEVEEQRRDSRIITRSSSSIPANNRMETKIQVLLKDFSLRSDLLPSLRLEYEAWNLLFTIHQGANGLASNTVPDLSFAGQLSKQEIRFEARSGGTSEHTGMENNAEHVPSGTFAIPVIRAVGKMRAIQSPTPNFPNKNLPTSIKPASSNVSTAADNISEMISYFTMDMVTLNLNVNLIDYLLTANSLMGSEINDVVDVFSFARRRKEKNSKNLSPTPAPTLKVSTNLLLYSVKISLQGLKVAALSPAAVGYFESSIMNGEISNFPLDQIRTFNSPRKISWRFSARNFALSLERNIGGQSEPIDGKSSLGRYRLAYIVIDFNLKNYKGGDTTTSVSESGVNTNDDVEAYIVDFSRIHAVMQPIALGKMVDLYVYYSTELTRRREQKANEIGKLAMDTRRLLQSLEVEIPKYTTLESNRSLWQEKLISLQISRFAVAMPLNTHENVVGQKGDTGAFLLSVSQITFRTSKWQQSFAELEKISAQFVASFDQDNEQQFTPEVHKTSNQLSFPLISCRVQYSKISASLESAERRHISIDALVSGFTMDVDATIVNNLNKMNEIYKTSVEQVNQFSAEAGPNLKFSVTDTQQDISETSDINAAESPSILLDIEAKFVYQSGICKLYPKNHAFNHNLRKEPNTISRKERNSLSVFPSSPVGSGSPFSDFMSNDSRVSSISIPGLSAWLSYRTVIGSDLPNGGSAINRAHAEVLIHPSENILNPYLVPFLQDIVAGLQLGMQQSSEKEVSLKQENSGSSAIPIQSMNLTLYLRLSKTKLDLTCQPYEKILCSLNWMEGNFLMATYSNPSTAIRTMTCIGKIKGASLTLRHVFAMEDCVKAQVKDILLNAALVTRRSTDAMDDSISIILDVPHVSAYLNTRQLQDLLIMKGIWFHVTNLAARFSNTSADDSADTSTASVPPSPFAQYFAIRLQDLDLSSDLGQSIGKVTFNTSDIKLDTKSVPTCVRSIKCTTDKILFKSEGRLVGEASMERLSLAGFIKAVPLSTVPSESLSVSRIEIRTTRLTASLEYEYQKILVAAIAPIEVECSDSLRPRPNDTSAFEVEIDTVITLQSIEALGSVTTLPAFIHIKNKLISLVADRVGQAEDRLRNCFETSETSQTSMAAPTFMTPSLIPTFSLNKRVIRPFGKISVDFKVVTLTVFPRQFFDNDCLQVIVSEIRFDLIRDPVEDDKQVHRIFNGKFNTLGFSKSAVIDKVSRTDEKSAEKWFNLAGTARRQNIMSIPETQLNMESWHISETNAIKFRFSTIFNGFVDMSLNITFLKYVTDLFNLLTERLKSSKFDGAVDLPAMPEITQGPAKVIVLPLDATTDKDIHASTLSDHKGAELEYVEISPVIFDPRVKILGDATPPLDWIGLRRHTYPPLVHENLTLNVEKLLLFLIEVYENQLQQLAPTEV